jgi:hypothetical protein
LTTPWYLPAVGTAATVLTLLAVWRGRTAWRIIGAVFCILLAGLEWQALIFASRLRPYTGPVEVGHALPADDLIRADGTPFDFRGDQNTVLVLFRGRW